MFSIKLNLNEFVGNFIISMIGVENTFFKSKIHFIMQSTTCLHKVYLMNAKEDCLLFMSKMLTNYLCYLESATTKEKGDFNEILCIISI